MRCSTRIRTLRVCFVGLATALAACPALGDLDKATVTKWLEARLAESQTDWYLPGLRVEYVVEWPSHLTAQAAAELAEAVKGKPDHPGRDELRQYNWERTNGPTRARMTYWFQEDGLWRHNSDQTSVDGASFGDEAVAGQSTWRLSAAQINIRPANGGASTTSTAPQLVLYARESLKALWFASLYSNEPDPSRVYDVRISGLGWSARVEFASKYRLLVEGTTHDGEVAVVSTLVEHSVAPDWIGVRWTFGDWITETRSGRVVPTRYEERAANGRLRYRVSQVAFVPVERAEVVALAALPDVKKPDPVRGELTTVQTVNDWRPDRKVRTQRLADGSEAVVPLAEPAAVHRGWQWVGWTIGSLILVVFFSRWIARCATGAS